MQRRSLAFLEKMPCLVIAETDWAESNVLSQVASPRRNKRRDSIQALRGNQDQRPVSADERADRAAEADLPQGLASAGAGSEAQRLPGDRATTRTGLETPR